jgi:hypothetical protein
MVFSILFQSPGNLMVFNSYNEANSILNLNISNNYEWTKYDIPEFMIDNGKYSLLWMRSGFIDSRSMVWFTNHHWGMPALCSYEPSSKKAKVYSTLINEDGTTINPNGAICTVEDKTQNIWLATDRGPLYLSASTISNGGETFTQYKVPRNDGTNLADYLLAGIDITSIAVDAANRKWFGTDGNGVYLVSSDNINEVHHFTRANSPLLSDYIEAIAVNHNSGSVYFATTQGLCSFAGDATATADEMTSDNVYAYPNPVRPDYQGPITIVGLS